MSGWKWHSFAFGVLVAGFLATLVTHRVMSQHASTTLAATNAGATGSDLPSLGELALMSPEELAKQDIALLNLRCADGLPGSESLDVERCLATLDEWAERVRRETDRHLYRYARNPAEFENSEAFYRMMMLVTVLQQDFGVHYNPEQIHEVDFTKSKDLFLHGMINSDNGGTCVSMPVLYTAIARRLGYPVYLVTANSHVFCRWDRAQERFNIEATNQGMNSFDDEYYMTWPKPVSQADVDQGWYLRSLDINESFAMFLAARGHCLEDNRFGAKARVAYAMAHEKTPQHPLYFGFLAQTVVPPSQEVFHFRQNQFVQKQNAAARAKLFELPPDVFKSTVPSTADPFTQQQTGLLNPAGFGIEP